MAYKEFFITCDSEADAIAAAQAVDSPLITEDENGNPVWVRGGNGHDSIGPFAFWPDTLIWQDEPVFDDDGNLVTPGVRKSGWHAFMAVGPPVSLGQLFSLGPNVQSRNSRGPGEPVRFGAS